MFVVLDVLMFVVLAAALDIVICKNLFVSQKSIRPAVSSVNCIGLGSVSCALATALDIVICKKLIC